MVLKIFEAGESIKAVDTNANNQYLEGLNTTTAAELQAYLEAQIEELQSNFLLTGTILALPYNTIPVGYLKCDGSSLLREDYDELFDKIGTTYGAVDDYHFNIPDYQGVFLRGYGGSSATLGTKQLSGAPNITGTTGYFMIGNQDNTGYQTGAFRQSTSSTHKGAHTYSDGRYSKDVVFNASDSSTVYQNGLEEIRPVNMSVIWVIKY